MKTSVIDVRDMLSVLNVADVEKRIGEVPGVESVTVNFAAGNATVRFDETRLELADIKSDVRQRGSDTATQPKAPAAGGHEEHAATAAKKPDAPEPGAPKTPPDSLAAAAEGNTSPTTDASAGQPVEPAKTVKTP